MSPREQTALLSRQRHWRRAHDLFDRLRALPSYAPNPVHYNVLLRHLARAHRWPELGRTWLRMSRDDAVPPSNPAYAALADALGKAGLAQESLLLLLHMRARGVAPDEVSMNTFVRILKNTGRYSDAVTLFTNWCDGRFDVEFLHLEYRAVDFHGPMKFLLDDMVHDKLDSAGALGVEEVPSRKPKLVVTYNTMIDLYGKAGRLKDAMDMFLDMLAYQVMPDIYTFNSMINVFGSHGSIEEAEVLLANMLVRGITPDIRTFNVLMTAFASVGDVEGVLRYYRQIGRTGLCADAVSYRIMLQVLCERKMVHEAEDVIQGIIKSATGVHEQSIPLVMKMYIDQGLLDKANAFFQRHCRGAQVSSRNYAAIMDAYADKCLWEEAEHIFHCDRGAGGKRDIVEYNVMVKAYGLAKQYDRVAPLLENMKGSSISPDECTYNSLIQMFSVGGFPQRAKKLLRKMKDTGFKPACETYSAVIRSYSHNSLVSEAIDMYNEMKASAVEPNVVVYGLMIDMFAETGQVDKALHYSNLMEESGIVPNHIILTSIIKAYSKVNCWKEAQIFYTRMRNMDGGPDIIASNTMLNLYAKLGMVFEAKAIFDSLTRNNQADDVSYITMMFLYKNMGLLSESIKIAHKLQDSGLLSDCAAYNAVMACYVAKGNLRECAELVQKMVEDSIFPDASMFRMIFSAMNKVNISSEEVLQLESAYNDGRSSAKHAILAFLFSMAGMHATALNICEQLLKPELAIDPCAYNVAFKVYASCGEVDKAFSLFTQMHALGLKPDTVTYIHLSTCYGISGMSEAMRRINGLLAYRNSEFSKSLHNALVSFRESGNNDLAAQLLVKKC
ncbi:hypothetical protein QYE76_041420 [Lolium multiflorum]|uniref:PROP1-like PPR domain-containing protein n=1 Tax=Lolium multiflorum TaxID=4521 RepID=A0AAD8TEY9_LOLMU|nr:hypothetical protein QYE76_041420 [Lolium multiflorum]